VTDEEGTDSTRKRGHLDASWLTSRTFSFHATSSNHVLATALRFEPNGRIGGYSHPNESGWRIEDGRLLILRRDGTSSCIATPGGGGNGQISLSGRFIDDPNVIHRFDENPSTLTLPEICTFDLFDTLVARRCYDPIAIFRAVEAQSGIADFARLRQTLEAQLWHEGDYDFEDIYRLIGTVTGWPEPLLKRLRTMELAEEQDNLFPIAEMVARVGPNDIIVSDMYLPLSFLRAVVDETCGLPGRPLHVASHGKSRGKIWSKLLASHHIRRHHGDNFRTDIESARQASIETEHVTIAQWTRGEQALRDVGLENFAMAVREARLTYRSPDLVHADGARAQFEFNLPLLILGSLDVLQQAAVENVDTLLMCARDCHLWVHLMRFLAPRSRAVPVVHYLVSSRILLLSGSADYLTYFTRMSGFRNMVVDVSGTGRSPVHFISTNGKSQNTSVYLLAAGDGVAKFMHDLAPERTDVVVRTLCAQLGHERMIVESVNMSLDGRAARLEFTGNNFLPKCEPNEFGPQARALISAMRVAFMAGLAVIEREVYKLPGNISPEDLRNAARRLIAAAPDFQLATESIFKDISHLEQTTASTIQAERQRAQQLGIEA
jgi:hypothetical protein